MQLDQLVQYLRQFGFTDHEARTYLSLCALGEATGYQIAKDTGLPRSNVYACLQRLVDRGAALRAEGSTDRYIASSPQDLVLNLRDKTEKALRFIEEHTPRRRESLPGFYNLNGYEAILTMAGELIDRADTLLLVDGWWCEIEALAGRLRGAEKRGVTVVAIAVACGASDLGLSHVYPHSDVRAPFPVSVEREEGRDLALVVDQARALVAEVEGEASSRGVVTENHSLVQVTTEALVHDILTLKARERLSPAAWEEMVSEVRQLLQGGENGST